MIIERLPEGSVKDAGIIGIGSHIGNAGEIVFVESFLPGLAAVGGFVHAAIFAGAERAEDGMAENADENDIGICADR